MYIHNAQCKDVSQLASRLLIVVIVYLKTLNNKSLLRKCNYVNGVCGYGGKIFNLHYKQCTVTPHPPLLWTSVSV